MKKENMGYKYSINYNDLRSELMGKVSLEGIKKETREVEVNLVDTLALNDLIQKIKTSNISDEDRRSEILDKFGNTQDDSSEEEHETPKFEDKGNDKIKSLIDDRSEISGKFDNNEESKKHSAENNERRKNIEIKLEDTIALDNVIENVLNIKLNEEDRRTELNGMFNKNMENKNVDDVKEEVNIKVEEEFLEDKEDKIQETTENISLAMVILIVVSCLIIGAIVGYMLYRIALNG